MIRSGYSSMGMGRFSDTGEQPAAYMEMATDSKTRQMGLASVAGNLALSLRHQFATAASRSVDLRQMATIETPEP